MSCEIGAVCPGQFPGFDTTQTQRIHRTKGTEIVEFHQMLGTVHSGTALLLFTLAMLSVALSVLIAVKPATDPANARLLKAANAVGFVEISTAGIVTLTGLILVYTGSWSLAQFWLWMSLLFMVFYSTALKRFTKPARQAVARGGSEVKVGMQVVLQVGHLLLLIVAFSMMLLKPGQ